MFNTLPHPTNNTTSLCSNKQHCQHIFRFLPTTISIHFQDSSILLDLYTSQSSGIFLKEFCEWDTGEPRGNAMGILPLLGGIQGSRPALGSEATKPYQKIPKMSAGRDKIIFQTIIFRFYVNLVGCLQPCKYHLHFSLLITRLQSSIRQAFQRPQFQWPSRCWHRLHLLHAMAKCYAVTPALEKTPAGFEKRGGVKESNDFLPQNQRKPSKFVDIFGFFKTLRIYTRQVI